MNKKVILFIIIILIVLGSSYLVYKKLNASKTLITYTISERSAKNVINLIVTSNNNIEKIELPDGTIKTYLNTNEVSLKYNITKNGEYTFIITDEKGEETKKVVKVTSFNEMVTTTKVATTTKVSYIDTDNDLSTVDSDKLKSLTIFNNVIKITNNDEYYYYYNGDDTIADIKYTIESTKATSAIVKKDLTLGDNIITITITPQNANKRVITIHLIKYNLNIKFSEIRLSNKDINATIIPSLIGISNTSLISKIEYSLTNSNLIEPTEYFTYTDGALINSNSYIWAKVTMVNGNVFETISDKYIVDKIVPTITTFNNITTDLATLSDGLIVSNDISYNSTDDTNSYVGEGMDIIRILNLKRLNISFKLTSTDNETSSLLYSYIVTNSSDINNETTGWSEWNTNNIINVTNIDQFNGLDYYFGFRVKDAAGNISNKIYKLPTYLNASTTGYYMLNGDSTGYRLKISDTCNNYKLVSNLNYGATIIGTNVNFCVTECPEGYSLNGNICEK